MALRVTARRAQRLGTIAPTHTPCVANNGIAPGCASSEQRCKAKWVVRATVAPARTAWNCARVLSRCMEANRKAPADKGDGSSTTGNGADGALDGEALAALGAACVDHGAAAAGLHADQEPMGAGAANFGGLVSAFHDLSS